MTKLQWDDAEVFHISISANRNAIRTLLGLLEFKLSGESLQSLARLVSQAVGQLKEPLANTTAKERSEHAHLGGQKLPTDMGLLVDTREATKLLKVSSRKLWEMENSGRMPKAVRIGRAVRWSYAELQAWIDEGCPEMDRMK